jgi:hypothetical protein
MAMRSRSRRDTELPVPAPPRRPRYARPGVCPRCGGRGYLDHIDVVRHVTDEHCRDCGYKWEVRDEETDIRLE